MEASTEKVKIISAGAIAAMLRRMAFEIYERNFSAELLVIAGIGPRGGYLADRIESHLLEISPIMLQRADFSKHENGLRWKQEPSAIELAHGNWVIVDDVLYSGGTIVEALVLASQSKPTKIQTAVLVDRGHHRFPVQGNYVGMEIATSLKQYVSVEVDVEAQRAEAFIF